MGGLSLLLAPTCIILMFWVTWSHFKQSGLAELKPSATAWLLPTVQGNHGLSTYQFVKPWLYASRLILLLLLCSIPTVYQPWYSLCVPIPTQGTMVLTDGPIRIDPTWEHPIWVVWKDAQENLNWVNDQAQVELKPVMLRQDTHELDLPYFNPSKPLNIKHLNNNTLLKEMFLSAYTELIQYGGKPKHVIFVRPQTPRLLGAKIQWSAENTIQDPPKLYLQAQLKLQQAPAQNQLWLEEKHDDIWKKHTQIPIHSTQASQAQLRFEQSSETRPLRLCLRDQTQTFISECLSLKRPPWILRLSQFGWSKGLQLILNALQGVEWVSNKDADWIALQHPTELSLISQAFHELNPTPKRQRIILSSTGSEKAAPIWSDDLSQGSLGIVTHWYPLSPYLAQELKRLFPWAKAFKTDVLLYAPQQNITQDISLKPILDEVRLSSELHSLTLNRIAWQPNLDHELTALSLTISRWVEQHRTRFTTCCQNSAHSLEHPIEEAFTFAQLNSFSPSEQSVHDLDVHLDHHSEDLNQEHIPSLQFFVCLLFITLSTAFFHRSLSTLSLVILTILWILSSREDGSIYRGLGGLWKGPAQIKISLDHPSKQTFSKAQEYWKKWQPILQHHGFTFTHRSKEQSIQLHVGNHPTISSPQAHWLIPIPKEPSPLQIHKISSAWEADQKGLWISVLLNSCQGSDQHDLFAQSPDAHYELWLQGSPSPRLIGHCKSIHCLGYRAAYYLSSPTASTSPYTISLYRIQHPQLSQTLPQEGSDIELMEERLWNPPLIKQNFEAWSWGHPNPPWIQAAGYQLGNTKAFSDTLPNEIQLISLHDIPAHRLPQQSVDVLEAWVKAGGTLFLSGRNNSFEAGGWLGTAIERLSPFISKPKESDQARVIFLIDVSGSITQEAGGLGVSTIIEDSLKLAAQLPQEDEVAMITFASKAELVLPPTPVHALNRIIATHQGSGGSQVDSGLKEALQWLGEKGPQRIIIITDGELHMQESSDILKELSLAQQVRDLSILIALTHETLPSTDAERILQNLEHLLSAQMIPLSQLTIAEFNHWRKARISKQNIKYSSESKTYPVWPLVNSRINLGESLPPVKHVAGVQLKQGATLLAEYEGKIRAPFLAEWRYGLGRVIALATDQWSPSDRFWRTLLSPSLQIHQNWRFSWLKPGSHIIARSSQQTPLLGRAVMIGHQGEMVSGQWHPLLDGYSVLRAQDGGPLDERIKEFDWLEIRSQSTKGNLKAQLTALPYLFPTFDVSEPLKHTESIKILDEQEANQPSATLLKTLYDSSTSPIPLPTLWMIILLLGLSSFELMRWRHFEVS